MRSGPADQPPLTDPSGAAPARRVPSTDGVTVALHDLGGTGSPLLLAHATGFHGRVWLPVARELPDHHAFAPDLRGHGDAEAPSGLAYEWQGFADDVLAVVDALGATDLVAAGHSKGGAALLLAEQRRPGTFRALYVYEPVVFPPSYRAATGANPLAEGALRRRAAFPSYEAAIENYAGKPPFDALRADALEAYVRFGFHPGGDGSVHLKCRPEVEAQVYRMGTQHDAFGHLAEVRCPVVVAVGRPDEVGPARLAPAIAEALPAGRLERHDDLGHFGPLEDPAAIARAIRAALD